MVSPEPLCDVVFRGRYMSLVAATLLLLKGQFGKGASAHSIRKAMGGMYKVRPQAWGQKC